MEPPGHVGMAGLGPRERPGGTDMPPCPQSSLDLGFAVLPPKSQCECHSSAWTGTCLLTGFPQAEACRQEEGDLPGLNLG